MALPLSLQVLAQAPKPAAAMQFVTEQPASEWLARVFLGADVQNASGERVGDINDLVFDRTGRISTVVLGVGGFLGMGEKNVGVPFSALTYTSARRRPRHRRRPEQGRSETGAGLQGDREDHDGHRKGQGGRMGHKTVDKAVELKDQAAKKIDDMTKPAPVKQ